MRILAAIFIATAFIAAAHSEERLCKASDATTSCGYMLAQNSCGQCLSNNVGCRANCGSDTKCIKACDAAQQACAKRNCN